uniref:NADH-ubiquinone oxidoreductase B16.6 subunit n=1 Tax=Panagrellus redivivus TaxID=6233 RepID=A0A7E4ZZK3_PANRE
MRVLASAVPATSTQVRHRATYHQQTNTWVPRVIRRFFLRYPRAPLYGVLGICVAGMGIPYARFTYNYITMSKEEFSIYRDNYNAVVRERQIHGNNLYIPFMNTNKAEEPRFPTLTDSDKQLEATTAK